MCRSPQPLFRTLTVLVLLLPVRDLACSTILLFSLWYSLATLQVQTPPLLYYTLLCTYGFCQGIVWTGLWIIGHDAGHSGFSAPPIQNDMVGFILHSFLLAPYFSWKSTHRRHHIYANHIEKDLNYIPPQRHEYAKRMVVAWDKLEEVGEDAPAVLFLRIVL
jgi:fatty acid desaturase